MLLLGDQPEVSTEAVAARSRRPGPRSAPRVPRRAGPPVVVRSEHVRELSGLHGDKAVWKLVEADEDVVQVRSPAAVPRDVDTWADYQALLGAADERT